MKNRMKKLVSLLLIVLFVLSLCGCTMDSIKESRATWIDKSKTIDWQGEEYVLLAPSYEDIQPILDYESLVYVTDEEVPLLLQTILGENMHVSLDGKFLVGWEWVYCRKDCYSEMLQCLEAGADMDGYCYEYWDENNSNAYYQLSDSEVQKLNDILVQMTPDSKVADEFYDAEEVVWLLDVEMCSDDMLFRSIFFEVWENEGEYYFVSFDETSDEQIIYKVPASNVKKIKDIFKLAF